MKTYMATIAQQLKRAREQAGLTQEEIAKRAGLKQPTYNYFENGKREISIDYLVSLSQILGKPLTWFLEIEDNGRYLSKDEKELLEAYRELPIDVKRHALGIVQDMAARAKQT